jgi:hypothetical protein
LWWTKWHWGKFSPNTLVPPANSHSSNQSTLTPTTTTTTTTTAAIIIINQSWYNSSISGQLMK